MAQVTFCKRAYNLKEKKEDRLERKTKWSSWQPPEPD